jgi:hypothetical protein
MIDLLAPAIIRAGTERQESRCMPLYGIFDEGVQSPIWQSGSPMTDRFMSQLSSSKRETNGQ